MSTLTVAYLDLLRRFGASLRGIQLYSPSHPIVARNLEGLAEALRALHVHDASVVIGILGGEFIVGDLPMTKASASMGELIRRFGALGIERITISSATSRSTSSRHLRVSSATSRRRSAERR